MDNLSAKENKVMSVHFSISKLYQLFLFSSFLLFKIALHPRCSGAPRHSIMCYFMMNFKFDQFR